MAQFRIDQATPGAGVAGRSRHDLVAGEEITLVATSPVGSGVTYGWEILDKVGSVAALSAASGTSTTVGAGGGSIVAPCAFLVRMTVDDNGTVAIEDRVFSVRSAVTGLRPPLFPETAPTTGTLAANDPSLSVDNAIYADRGGLGASAQNWRGWAEWAWEVSVFLESVGAGGASGPAGGDLAGTYPNPGVAALRGTAVQAGIAPADGDVLTWANAASEWQAAVGGASGAAGGDLNGTYPNPTVDGLQGVVVSATAPADGDVLAYSLGASEWGPAPNPSSALGVVNFSVNGPIFAASVPTGYVDGLREVGVAGVIASVHMTQVIDGTTGKTQIQLYKVDLAGTETAILTAFLELTAGGGDKARAVSTSFVGGGVENLLATDRLGIKINAVQDAPSADLLATVVMVGNSLVPPATLPESNEVNQAVNSTVLGTTYQWVGSVYLPAGTILAAQSRVMLGTDQVADSADLQIRRFTGGAVLDTISATGIPQDAQPASDIAVVASDWYDLYLRASVITTNAILRGLKLAYQPSVGARIREAFNQTQTGTTPLLVGSVYLPGGTLQEFSRCMLGTSGGGTATLELRRFTGSVVVATWTATGALQDASLVAPVPLPAEDWYDVYIYGDAAPTVAVVRGLDFTVLT